MHFLAAGMPRHLQAASATSSDSFSYGRTAPSVTCRPPSSRRPSTNRSSHRRWTDKRGPLNPKRTNEFLDYRWIGWSYATTTSTLGGVSANVNTCPPFVYTDQVLACSMLTDDNANANDYSQVGYTEAANNGPGVTARYFIMLGNGPNESSQVGAHLRGPLDAAANPATLSYVPVPEWFFLPSTSGSSSRRRIRSSPSAPSVCSALVPR